MKRALILALLLLAGSAAAQTPAWQVNLTCTAPTLPSPETLVGFNFYRAPSGSNVFTLLNSAATMGCSYTDTTVANSTTYQYYMETVAANVTGVTGNVSSGPSPVLTIAIPGSPSTLVPAPGAPAGSVVEETVATVTNQKANTTTVTITTRTVPILPSTTKAVVAKVQLDRELTAPPVK